MAIFLNEQSKVIVQGMTGSEGMKHTPRMLRAGTNVVGGVNPRKAGQKLDFDGTSLPVFGTVAEAMNETGADTTVIFVPPAFAKSAVLEAVDAAIGLAVVITEGIPVHDSAYAWRTRSRQVTKRGSSGRTVRASRARVSRTPGSFRRTSPVRGRLVWCRSRDFDLSDDVRAAGHRVLDGGRDRW